MKKFIEMLNQKDDNAKSDSDFAFFFRLLVSGEAITKLVVLIIATSLNENKERQQYKILHSLVRASGIGEWSKAIDDMIKGTASQNLSSEFQSFQREFTEKCTEDKWQAKAVNEIIKSLNELDIDIETPRGKKDLKSWFKYFTELRNKTRGHGTIPLEKASRASVHLETSLNLITTNLSIFQIPTAYLRRNLSGKYRVTELTEKSDVFNELKNKNTFQYEDGLYIYLNSFRKVPLLISDADLQDFYIANGGFSNTKYELLSYCTDDKKNEDSSFFLQPIGQLPDSESIGLKNLETIGNCFTNVPTLSYQYINRDKLENELYALLADDRRTVVTLLGRGGIGKTSLALRVIPKLYETTRFDIIIWFSSRDIDLQSNGAKIVTADVITNKDISKYYSKLLLSEEKLNVKGFNPIEYFQNQLTRSEVGPCLFVFDNFETTENPTEQYKWIDTYIRDPNKVLITTRLRDFKGDYPLNVEGMTKEESRILIEITAEKLNVKEKLTEKLIEDIFTISAGHPYIIKIIIGDLAKNNMKGSITKIVAGSEDILIALFERTYAALNPSAQRVFLTLSAWNSAVPKLVFEAVLMNSMEEPLEVEKAIETLLQFSMIEEVKSSIDNNYYIGLPFVAISFGTKKLSVSPLKGEIKKDIVLLQQFGPTKLEDKNLSLEKNLTIFLGQLTSNKHFLNIHKNILESICRSYNNGYLLVARWLAESSQKILIEKARGYLYLYLENNNANNSSVAWKQIAELSRQLGDHLDEVHALIEASLLEAIDFYELSNVINKVNHMLSNNRMMLDKSGKKELLSDLFTVVWNRKSEANANDYSRIAWLALHLHKNDEAENLINEGLLIDSENEYCLKLKLKLEKVY